MNRSYEDLRVWKEAMDLTKDIYKLTSLFPKEERYGLVQQMQRSAVSVPSNIAEGCGRNGLNEFYQFLGVASGSLAELKTQLLISLDVLSKLSEPINKIIAKLDDVGKMLNGLKKSIHEQRTTSNEQRL